MNIKKISLIIVVIAILLGIGFALLNVNNNKNDVISENNGVVDNTAQNSKISVVASNFASYDFLRAIIGNVKNIDLKFLLGPGKDAHSYEPTPGEIVKIQDSDLFIYIGGEMEKWSDKVLNSIKTDNTKIICIADFVETIEEQEVDGAEEDHEEEEEEVGAFDEHIWTSPKNAIEMINALEQAMEEIDKGNASIYKENANKYIAQIKDVDNKIRDVVNNKVRDRLVFADKMPMQYFIDYYDLKVSAAFNGCSTETEPSARTIAYLENKIKEEKIPVVLYIELNSGKVAQTIADETETKAMKIQALHNVSLDDFNNGETWVSLMTRNIDVLKSALQ